MRESHEGGIIGIDKTLAIIQCNFHWSKTQGDVQGLLSRCANYQKT